MSAPAVDLGDLRSLAKALGLLDGSDNFRTDWLTDPGRYLSAVLADDSQRGALVEFLDDILESGDLETDTDGRVWLPLAKSTSPQLTVYIVLDPAPADHVAIGVGARLNTTTPAESRISAHVPIFRAAKSGHSVPDPILIGRDDSAQIQLDLAITFGAAPPLGGIGFSARVPTTAGPAPQFTLSLKRLQLPGAAAPSDLNISLANLASLKDSILPLLLGLARAQAGAAGVPQLSAVLGLLGLDASGSIPSLPLDAIAAQGPQALAAWFSSVAGNPSARAAWLARLASLLNAAATADRITFTLGIAQIALGLKVQTGAGGHTVVTPSIAASVTSTDFRASAEADFLELDLGTGTARALPAFSLFAQIGKRSDGGTRLLSGDPQVDAVRVGLRIDSARRPNFLLAADGVVISGHSYASLDLTSPGALAEVGATLLGAVVAGLLAQLGPVGTAAALLLGVTPPPSAPGAQVIQPADFLRDPLAAIRAYWRGILHDHPTAVTDLLATFKNLIAADGTPAVSGSGTAADPWRLPIAGPVGLDLSTTGGDSLDIALSARYIADNLGQRCTRVETSVGIGLAHLDFQGAATSFVSSIDFAVLARPRGGSAALLGLGPLTLSADSVGVALGWKPASGVSVRILAPNLAVLANGETAPVVLPVLGADGSLVLDNAGWDSLERFIGLLASAAPVPWIGHLADGLGWTAGTAARPHLRLATFMASPASALQSWLVALALDDQGGIRDALESLARALTGSAGEFGALSGVGRSSAPFVLPILPVDRAPQLALWLEPAGPAVAKEKIPSAWQAWRPGAPGLNPFALAGTLAEEAALYQDVARLVGGRPDLGAGFSLLLARWTGTDGRIVPPAADPPGITVHRIDNASADDLAGEIDLAAILGAAPATVVRIAVAAAGDASPWPDAPANRLLDLRAAGRAPETFAQPAAAAGEWFIALAQRADARLASGDPDGTGGQAARLSRVLAPFASVAGGVVLIARDAAGHAALAAANTLPFVSAVITLGTPLTPVAFTVLDDEPAADAFRLLRLLLPPPGSGVPESPELATGRSMVNALAALLPFGDPGREIAPAAVTFAPRAGLKVHAFFGVLDQDAVLRAMTATVAAGLFVRGAARDAAPRPPVKGLRFALRMPVSPAATGLTVSGFGQLILLAADAGAGTATVSTARALNLHLEIRRVNGWLVGGPGVGLGAGLRPQQELRWLDSSPLNSRTALTCCIAKLYAGLGDQELPA